MITKKKDALGLWKCGKGRIFTHIPTYFIFCFKVNPFKMESLKEGRRSNRAWYTHNPLHKGKPGNWIKAKPKQGDSSFFSTEK